MNRVVHFEIHASEPEKLAKFYQDVFGWEINEWEIPGVELEDKDRYWQVGTGEEREPGIDGGLMLRQGEAPVEGQAVNAYVCVLDTQDIDGALEKVRKAGGSVTVPKMPVQGVGWAAYCKDPDGNIFGLMQEDESAAG